MRIRTIVSSDFLPALGVTPALGRGFATGEDRAGGQRVAVISSGFWRSHFGGDPSVLGRTADFNGEPYTIVGVLPATFMFPYVESDVYLPAFKYPNYSLSRAQTSCAVIARLADGVSAKSAQAEMESIAEHLSAAYPATNRGRGASVVSLREDLFARRKPVVIALAGAVAFVLLIACANIAGLMIARMMARQRERAVRIALGAGRASLYGHVLAEAGVLAAAGGAGGLLLALWAMPAIAQMIAVYLPDGVVIQLDGTALLFTAALTALSALLVAAIPALQHGSLESLRTSRGSGSGAGRNRARNILVSAEIALALVLLAGAGLMMRSLEALSRAQPGFDTRNLAMMAYRIPRSRDQPVWSIHSFDEILANQRNGIHRLVAITLSAYAALALLLGSIGIFGLMTYAVSQRRGEIGVRIALGARPADILKLVIKDGFTVVMTGIGVGTIAAAWLSRYLESQLYSVSPIDPTVYAGMAILLAAVALAACTPAMRRATRVDPVTELRGE